MVQGIVSGATTVLAAALHLQQKSKKIHKKTKKVMQGIVSGATTVLPHSTNQRGIREIHFKKFIFQAHMAYLTLLGVKV